ncbi:MAG: Bcr/CflA family drug resistance efflux transporter [Gammaproteobacteria bacterium]|nr:MAG: Bcr/CflA family drug resistance efflux transporter [Gammaproteobacteria bacterium]
MSTASSDTTRRTNPKLQLTLTAALLSMVGPFSINAYLPSFPDIEAAFGVSRVLLSQSLTVYLVAFAISTLFWGPLSDRIGRRKTLLASMSLYLVASIGCALATDAHSFVLLRAGQGLAASGGFIIGRSMIRDSYDTRSAQKAMAHVTLIFALGPAIAPIVGGWLQEQFGWRSIFWFLGSFGLLLLLLGLAIKETLPEDKRSSFHPYEVGIAYWKITRHTQFVCLIFSLSMGFGGVFVYIAGAPTVIYKFLGLTTNDFGLQFIPMVAGMMLGSYYAGRKSQYWPPARTLFTGFAIMAIATVLNLFLSLNSTATIFTVIAPLALYAFGYAMLMPVITILALDYFPQRRGSATSMQGFVQVAISATVTSIAIPLLHDSRLSFAIGQLLFLCVAVALILIYYTIEKRAAAQESKIC